MPSAAQTTRDDFTVRDWLLIALTFASGAIDAISYFGLGKVFSAFMTGNIVFLGFALANAGEPNLVPVICALAFFTIGSLVGARIALPLPQQRGLWHWRVSLTLAIAAAVEAGGLAVWMANAGQPAGQAINVLVSLFSLAMGLQTAAVRAFGVPGVFTTAATFTLVALAGDFAGPRPKAETLRLTGVLLGLVAGATAGAWLFLRAASYAPLLPLVVTVLVLLAGMGLGRERHETGALAAPTASAKR
jgi:uncharacterized membrane protein YoaK (UPF0700 family)